MSDLPSNPALPAFMTVNNVALHHRVGGPNQAARTLVFLNSLGSDLRIWDAVAPAFAATLRTVQYDQRGHGLSDAPPAPYTLRDHTGDLKGLLDTLGIERAVLVGVSVGGMIAQDFAAAYPERTEGLVLIGTGVKIGTPDLWNERIEAAEQKNLARVAPAALSRWFTPAFFEKRPAEARGYLNMLVRTAPEGYAGTCAALREADLREQTARLKVPAVVLCGEGDTSTPPELNRELADLLGAPLHLIPGAAHIPSVEQPGAVIAHIRHFLGTLPRTGAGERYETGLSVRRRVLGEDHVERATANVSDLDRDFQTFITEYAWGGPWSRGHLDTRTRHLLTLAVLTALPREHELAMHIRATENTGVSEEDLREVFLHVAVYAGVPVANRAFQIARQVLAERNDP
ncbi:3-oxoadipate enol-lactonase [Deinococcus metallilatus]|uniref:3-oxoadipate enol-lactonase n=1 Tax=Deinococcus metallilatus TaxID=1211322 RepID=A0AAJ5F4N7_9DEIO|nr:3-oxoadipate enol-lactonase [Deinococcus metallilatus]MBB5294195.1 3-oxoadipate enol-lactonase/4-carboxymuconolactone decarboxylase [Deinococcus metallilatus]QBY08974.1 3-oxoadipate enol-lactonase [Deinococcus metallilatus]RXJ10118.1 3-oxoadipate enol-lactonase [Deinococcus metallilatus]TLK27945.1 3-oxoadipate enol-lactonase [Deinococcus metallilatus]GMA16468.1 3-oxoadipate enol-lactonase [Deinococcus metallilatus]